MFLLSRFARYRSVRRDVRPPEAGRRHSLGEDVYAFAIGSSFLIAGMVMLREAGLVTGGMAGIALLLSYLVPVSPSTLFLLVNLPFLLLAWRVMGKGFTVKTGIVSVLIVVLGAVVNRVVAFDHIEPLVASLFGGTIIGMGILSLARHAAGVGGSGVVALSLQKTRGWNAGRTQLIGDVVILALSLPIVETAQQFALSVMSAAAINGVLIVNHKPGRYLGY
ncbi:YitT family protein [Parvularcula dongshanensis]|uniref:Uncharacterized membrane-anchored protein YitT (DUF2179 family) n=1 Tax=Parvularcula dongshanensis TaxID=1173995 RepID=A0A840I3D1_9PROT|nr:YitT family protein [Parvularcula dongshanensis]MBB4659359.1 uncharacterized membrane-anchored protein YitT (DUF2179 family) [Parvularcula dongshanensis]